MATTLSRDDKKALTRSRLLASAWKVFAAKGYRGAAVDDVAIEAGLTKGAVYAHFRTKEALFLALVRERGLANLAKAERLFDNTTDNPERRTRALIARGAKNIRAREWTAVSFEFILHATRDPALRREIRQFYDRAREVDAELIERGWRDIGVKPAISGTDFARLVNGVTLQLAIEQLLDPKADLTPVVERTLSFLLRAARASQEDDA
jgi:AcrR family transcriptional regulator